MNITVLGCGSYGLAISSILLNNNAKVTIWNKFQNEIDNIKDNYQIITFTTSLEESIKNTNLIIVAIPVNFLETTFKELKPFYHNQDIIITSKGIDKTSNKFAYQIIKDILNIENIAILSGGSFAKDIHNKQVQGLTLATTSKSIRKKAKKYIANNYIKLQYTTDLIGVSICGSLKNVMAIAYGILDNTNYSESTKSLFLTEAIYEISYLIKKLKGNKSTIMTYSGLNDIIMTCTSKTSRNYTLGSLIGQNKTKEEIEKFKNNTTIEGLHTAKSIYTLTQNYNITLPITNIIYKILYNNLDYKELINYLKQKKCWPTTFFYIPNIITINLSNTTKQLIKDNL